MYFRILGPLQVCGDRPVVVTAARQQTLLAVMLLEANQILPVDLLVDAVWDENPPPTARSQIQICVSALRRSLDRAGLSGLISTSPPGYRLSVPDGELDLHLFDNFAADGRKALPSGDLKRAAALFRQALALWRGEPLAGLGSRMIRAAAASVSERHIALVEECIDVELELGWQTNLISELMELVAEYPLRERLRAQLMLALYRAGRRADALDAFRSARQTLVDELGLEPGEPLRRLERAILTDDPDLVLPGAPATGNLSARAVAEVPPRRPQMLPADIPDFTGHDNILKLARDQWCKPDGAEGASAPRILVITGRAGVGKTTLAVHLAHQLLKEFPDGQLFAQLGRGSGHTGNVADTLERFLRAQGIAGSAIPDRQEERAAMYRSHIAGRRMLVVLDDAADERQVEALLPASPSCGVLVTSRLRLASVPGARFVDIDVLDPRSALDLLASIVGWPRVSTEPTEALDLIELCGRLPLAIRIAGARLAARSHWTIGQLTARLADDARRLDELTHGGLGVRASIGQTYDCLDADAKKLFWRLGILEVDEFAGWIAAPLLNIDPVTAADVLEVLVDTRLVDVVSGTGDTTRYRLDDLVRVYAREKLANAESSAERMDAIRRLLGAWLFLAESAHRRSYGGDYTLIHSHAPRWELAGPFVDRLLADPLAWYESERSAVVATVDQAARSGAVELCWDFAITMVAMFEARNYLDDWRSTHEAALRAAQRGQDRRGEAAMLYSLGSLYLVKQQFDEAEARLTLALAVFDEIGEETHGRALTLRNLAFLDRTRGDVDTALRRYRDALTGLLETGDTAGEAHVLSSIAQILLDTGETVQARQTLDTALRVATSSNSSRVRAQVLHRLGEAQLAEHQLDAAQQSFTQALALVKAGCDKLGEAYAQCGLGVVQTRKHRHDEAFSTLNHAHNLARQSGDLLATGRSCLALAELHYARGEGRRAGTWASCALDAFTKVKAAAYRKQVLTLFEKLDGCGSISGTR